jgi:biopolymer transport protein ExbD
MGVIIPGYHLKSPKDLPELRRRLKGSGSKRHLESELVLTSMIDMFSVVILFLIQSFSATGEIMAINPGISLPQAYYAKELERNPIVTVTADKVTVEGLKVGDNSAIFEKIEDSDWDLPNLKAKLDEYKQNLDQLIPGLATSGKVIIQADKGLEFVYLKRVIYALTKMGFPEMHLAVRGEARGGQAASVPEDAEKQETSQESN